MEKENERQTFSVRPTKPVSRASTFVLVFMFLFGVGFAILVGQTLYENEAPIGLYFVFSVFIIGWLGMVLYMLNYNLQNLRRPKGAPFIEIDVGDDK
jgi:hypothetical protein